MEAILCVTGIYVNMPYFIVGFVWTDATGKAVGRFVFFSREM